MPTDRSEKTLKRGKAARDFVTLAKTYKPGTHVVSPSKPRQRSIWKWSIHEKLDGVRARWHKGQFLSRSTKPFPVPEEVLDYMRRVAGDLELDGELIYPGDFQKTVSVVRNSHSTEEDWRELRYCVFDIDCPGTYETRMGYLEQNLGETEFDFIQVTEPLGWVENEGSIDYWLEIVTARGGEGLILRDDSQEYIKGRSATLLKVKKFMDEEATVVSYVPGEGKHEGRLGALWFRLDDGVKGKVGTGFTDRDREHPPAIGARITVKFFEKTNKGVPRFPIYIGERNYE